MALGIESPGPQCAFETSMFMCPAVHTTTRILLRPSSTHEPSDPPFRVLFCKQFAPPDRVRPSGVFPLLTRRNSRLLHVLPPFFFGRNGPRKPFPPRAGQFRGVSADPRLLVVEGSGGPFFLRTDARGPGLRRGFPCPLNFSSGRLLFFSPTYPAVLPREPKNFGLPRTLNPPSPHL